MIDLRVVVDEDGHTVCLRGSHIDEPGGVILRECRSPEKAQVFAAEVMVALKPLVADRDRLLAAIKEHHAQEADDRCWLDDHSLYTAAGLPLHDDSVGDRFAMVANCIRFVNQRCSEGGLWKSYAELEAENTRLREALLTFSRLAGPADIDPSEDGTGKTTVAEFVKRVLESK